MHRGATLAWLLVVGLAVPVAAAEPGPRVRFTIDEGWRYAPGPAEGAEAPGFDDRGWQAVDLPHTWNVEDAFDDSPDYRRGVGWYRKRLALDTALRGRRLFLYFEGANQVADVFVDGRPAGRHVGGYTAFAFDVTALVRFDRPNVVAVRVNNSHDPDVPPLEADFTFYGGIYRDVWLIATAPIHLAVLDHASPGVYVDTPEVSAERAAVRVRGTVVDAGGAAREVEVVSRVRDPEGREVAAFRARLAVPAGGQSTFELAGEIERPRLWSPDSPAVYRVATEVVDGGRVVDRVEAPLGFRWFRADPERGFLLNGRPLRLTGTNRHQDREGLGNALPDAAHREDVELVAATGCDFLRLAHYPQDPAVLEAMDRLGLLGWEEIPVVNTITLSDEFAANAERMLVEMIRQHYNHPSIVFWGIMNEALLRPPDPLPAGYREAVAGLARRLHDRARREDPSRPTAMAISFDEVDDPSGFQDVTDVLGLNLYFGWYYGGLDDLGPFLDDLRARRPERPLLVSEYGAGSDERIHAAEPVAFDFSTEHQQRFHESQLPQLLARDWLAGTAVWNQFDFGSQGRQDSKPSLNQKGLLYFDRRPKDVWHYYRARLLDEPVLHVAVGDRPRRAGSRAEDARGTVAVYSNLDEVELSVNGETLGRRRPENATARWDVRFAPGENRLQAVGRRGGERAVSLGDAAVVTYEDRTPLFTAGAVSPPDLAVNAGGRYEVVDRAGTVWEADRAWVPGSWGHVGGATRLVHPRIAGTSEHPLWQATREDVEAYRFDVPDGEYEVTVGLVETVHDRAGERVFTVLVNGRPLFREVDLAAEHGRHVAVERTDRVTASGGQGITIELQPLVGETTVAAFRLHRR